MFKDIKYLKDNYIRYRMIYTLLSRLEKYNNLLGEVLGDKDK